MADFFVNRIVEHPGRMDITPVNGTIATAEMDDDDLIIGGSSGAITADIVRAEGMETEEGTPLNAQSLNTGINSMVADFIRGYVIASSNRVRVPFETGAEYIVIWTGAGATGSRGIDYIWFSDGAVVSRSVSLTGTQLLFYGTVDDDIIIENSASATTVHATVITSKTA